MTLERWEAPRLLVAGGRSSGKPTLLDYGRCDTAVLLDVNIGSGEVETLVEHRSPRSTRPPDEKSETTLFAAGTLEGDRYFACTETEILVYSYPEFEVVRYLTLPCFNDLHHVTPRANGRLLVADTGLDMVLEIDDEDRVVRCIGGLGEPNPWERFDRRADYRRVPSTKPHRVHPNFVFEIDGRVWFTRFEQRDAVSFDGAPSRIPVELERPHDGVVFGGEVYFTTVDGHIVVGDPVKESRVRTVDLQEIAGGPNALGWCRGLLVLDSRRVVVGFSRLRPTRFRENVRWLKNRVGLARTPGNRPTRLACFDLENRELLWERDLEDSGLNLIFSVHLLEGSQVPEVSGE